MLAEAVVRAHFPEKSFPHPKCGQKDHFATPFRGKHFLQNSFRQASIELKYVIQAERSMRVSMQHCNPFAGSLALNTVKMVP